MKGLGQRNVQYINRTNARREPDKVVKPHFKYEGLGLSKATREANYRGLFRYDLELGLVDKIRKAMRDDLVLGDNRFREEIGKTLGRRVIPGKAGRPIKSEA
ncbi:MAG: hypothetical protein COA75_08385 [Cellvibrionales bacterium]|nr:MAG: hypothetical protein COA75_08385 [Cellvibrionales bacterium]